MSRSRIFSWLSIVVFIICFVVNNAGAADISAIASGWSHTIALREDGTVWSWGDNSFGQLGDGTTIHKHIPVQVEGLTDVAAIAAGERHTIVLKTE